MTRQSRVDGPPYERVEFNYSFFLCRASVAGTWQKSGNQRQLPLPILVLLHRLLKFSAKEYGACVTIRFTESRIVLPKKAKP